MAITSNRRNSTQCLWSSLIITTVVACGALVYISVLFGKGYPSEARSLKDIAIRPGKLTEGKCISVCESGECVLHSILLLNNVETTVDPCENFFEFACGNYAKQFWNESRNHFLEGTLKTMVILKNILENIDADPASASGKVKVVYDSCIKQSSSDFQAIPTLLRYLSRFGIPNWPNLGPDFKFVEPSLFDVLSNFLTYQEYGFIEIESYMFSQEMPQIRATISASQSTYEKKKKFIRKYFVEKLLQYFNVDSETIAEIWRESEAIHDIIRHLKKESERIQEEYEDPTTINYAQDNETERENIQEESIGRYHASTVIFIDCVKDNETEWKPVCEILESLAERADFDADISKRFAEVRKNSVYFMQNFIPALGNFSDRSIANYLTLNLLFNHVNELNFYFRLISQKDPDSGDEFTTFKKGIRHWEFCIEWLIDNMFIPLWQVSMKEVFTDSLIQQADDLIEECKREAANAISNQEWIEEAVRIELSQKTGNITNESRKLQELRNETLLNYLYDKFHPADDNFLRNVFEHQKFFEASKFSGFFQGMKIRSTAFLSLKKTKKSITIAPGIALETFGC